MCELWFTKHNVLWKASSRTKRKSGRLKFAGWNDRESRLFAFSREPPASRWKELKMIFKHDFLNNAVCLETGPMDHPLYVPHPLTKNAKSRWTKKECRSSLREHRDFRFAGDVHWTLFSILDEQWDGRRRLKDACCQSRNETLVMQLFRHSKRHSKRWSYRWSNFREICWVHSDKFIGSNGLN